MARFSGRRIGALVVKEYLHILRDTRTLGVAVSLPIVLLILYGYALNLDVRDINTVVYDQSHTLQSREVVRAFTNSGYFRVVGYAARPADLDRALDTGRARVALAVPWNFADLLQRGRPAEIQVLVDGSDSLVASTITGYVSGIASSYSNKLALTTLRRVSGRTTATVPLDARVRIWYNPELSSTYFIVPGLIATILAMLGALLTSLTVVREREQGTMEQLVVSPVTSSELMIGKLIPYIGLGMLDVLIISLIGVGLFGVPLRGSVLLLGALSLLFVIASLSLGLVISALSSNQPIAMTTALFVTQLPTILLSGFLFPIRSMPRFFQALTVIIPARHYLVIVRGIFLKGIGLGVLWLPSLALVAFAAITLTMAAVAFRKRL